MATWDESKHPRKPAGSPKGGEFTVSKTSKASRFASLVSKNLGGPSVVPVESKRVRSEKDKKRLAATIRMNLVNPGAPGGYAERIYKARMREFLNRK